MSRSRRAILALALLLSGPLGLLSACNGGYELVVEMRPESLRDQAQGVELFVIDSCDTAAGLRGDDPPAALVRIAIARDGQVSGLSNLPSGSYGLYGRAYDASCVAIAEGCTEARLSRDASGTLVLPLGPTAGTGCLERAACGPAICGGGGIDAGPVDAGPVDAGPVDAGPMVDAGPGAPIARFMASETSGSAPLLVAFDGTASEDPDGTIVGYHWDFGDGSPPQMGFALSTIGYRFDTPGTYTVTLTVTDDADLIGRAMVDVEVLP